MRSCSWPNWHGRICIWCSVRCCWETTWLLTISFVTSFPQCKFEAIVLSLLPHTTCAHVRAFEVAPVPLVNPLPNLAIWYKHMLVLDAGLGNRKFCMFFLAYTISYAVYTHIVQLCSVYTYIVQLCSVYTYIVELINCCINFYLVIIYLPMLFVGQSM